jgi:predicted  nucleic acid-binding Zn-ribbon protein
MKAISYIFAIVASCGAAFFSYSHSVKFGNLEKDRMATISQEKQLSSEADVADKDIKNEKERLAKSEERRDLLTQSVSSLTSEGTGLGNEKTKLDGELKNQADDFAQLKTAMDEVNATIAQLGTEGGEEITLDTLPAKIDELSAEKDSKQAKLDELQTLVSGAEKSLSGKRADLDRLAKRAIERNVRIARNATEAVVTAVNQDWGFLVIGAGSNSGFTPQSALLVERDGRRIGRVKPSSIEPTQTIAEIDMDSLAPGVRIQPGDRVILATPVSN